MGLSSSVFYEKISGDAPPPDKFALFHAHAQELGFTDAFYARARLKSDGEPSATVYRKWDQDWLSLYEGKRYRQIDPAFKAARTTSADFGLELRSDNAGRLEREFYADAKAHNRYNGFATPIKGVTGVVAGFSVTGLDRKPSAEQINRIKAAGHMLDLVVKAELSAGSAKAVGLSFREVKYIQFLAQGYSMVQIAHLNDNSEQWIRKSFMQIRGKLNVGSNPELVLKALYLGLL